MKREPDRLDFLIALLPVILIGLLGFQVYEYIQMDRQRVGTLPVNVETPPAVAVTEPPVAAEAADPAEPVDAAAGDPAASEDPADPDAQPADSPADDTASLDAGGAAAETEAAPAEAVEPGAVDSEPTADQAADAMVVEAELPATEAESDAVADPETAEVAPVPANPAAGMPAGAVTAQPLPLIAGSDSATPKEAVGGQAEVLILPQVNPTKVGELFTVDVLIQDASGVSGIMFHMRYDKALLQLNEDPQAEMGPYLEDPEGGTRFSATGLANGKVVVSINMPYGVESRSGDGRLATFHFQALAAGETRLDLLQAVLRDANNRPLPAVFTNARLLIVE